MEKELKVVLMEVPVPCCPQTSTRKNMRSWKNIRAWRRSGAQELPSASLRVRKHTRLHLFAAYATAEHQCLPSGVKSFIFFILQTGSRIGRNFSNVAEKDINLCAGITDPGKPGWKMNCCKVCWWQPKVSIQDKSPCFYDHNLHRSLAFVELLFLPV